MASSAKYLSLLFLLLSLSTLSTQARVSEFFSKAMRFDAAPTKVQPTELPPTNDADPNTFTFTPESSNGYGLYGHGAEETPAGEYNTPAQEFHVGNYQSKGSSNPKEYRNAKPRSEEVEFENNEFTTSYPEKEDFENRQPATRYPTESYEFENPREEEPARKERTRVYDNVEATRVYDNVEATRKYENGRFSRNYSPEHHGMSDTRTLENGRYFYDVKNDNYRGNPYSSTTANVGYGNEGYYGATENQNEYQNRQDDPNGYMP
ncbi:protein E6-like [Aristolochia californica]|uniref:protein E6-like n=1 Tax=Aristolochia californica TaxID=171875 RepID=UPI0035D87CFF